MPRTRAGAVALCTLLVELLAVSPLCAQDPPVPAPAAQGSGPIRVFLDCPRCDSDYLRTEIRFVDYVREGGTPTCTSW